MTRAPTTHRRLAPEASPEADSRQEADGYVEPDERLGNRLARLDEAAGVLYDELSQLRTELHPALKVDRPTVVDDNEMAAVKPSVPFAGQVAELEVQVGAMIRMVRDLRDRLAL